ncbi:hypothetical protein ASD70_13885 [Pseudomonas sp. Root569]|nr:hypothetical protein ASD70_13885 [Pseudomonas sp. Root569]
MTTMNKPLRNTSVDLIRTAALIGICVVNLPFLALPPAQAIGIPDAHGDRVAAFLIEFLFQGKFFLIFSFIFGWGVHIQIQSAARAGVQFKGRYFRRLIGLAIFGCLHAVLVFPGDILLLYAFLGCLLWPFRNCAPRTLIRTAMSMVGLELITLVVLAVLLSIYPTTPVNHALDYNFVGSTLTRISEWPGTFGFLILFQGPLAFGAILLGLAAAKAGFFEPGSRGQKQLTRITPLLLLQAVLTNLAFALAPKEGDLVELMGLLSFAVGAPLMSAVYINVLLRYSTWINLPDVLIAAGRNSLTAYVLQGLIAGVVFGGYGLGFFGELGNLALIPLAVGIALISMTLTGLIAKYAGQAPLEKILRLITYGPQRNGGKEQRA